MATNLEVDAFEIDIETLDRATWHSGLHSRRLAQEEIVEEVIKNLALDDKKSFEEYQKRNNPCR